MEKTPFFNLYNEFTLLFHHLKLRREIMRYQDLIYHFWIGFFQTALLIEKNYSIKRCLKKLKKILITFRIRMEQIRWGNPLNKGDFVPWSSGTKSNCKMGLRSFSLDEIKIDSLHVPRFRSGRIARSDLLYSPFPMQIHSYGSFFFLDPLPKVKGPQSLALRCLIVLLEKGWKENNPLLRDFNEMLTQLEKCKKCQDYLTHTIPLCPEGCWGCQDKFCTAKYSIRFSEKEIREVMVDEEVCRGCSFLRLYPTVIRE